MANRRPDPEPEPEPERRRLNRVGESAAPWDSPAGRAHVLDQIRRYGIQEWHNYWGSGTPLEVRRELIAEALLAPLDEDAP